MSKGKGKLYSPKKPANEKLYSEKPKATGLRIGITYLDRSKYGLEELCKAYKNDKECIQRLNQFILSARQMDDIGEFISKFISHKRGKNDDRQSIEKIKRLKEKYKLEIEHLIHLHCQSGGTGKFVVHGFQTGNVFEIVWLDPEHEIHES